MAHAENDQSIFGEISGRIGIEVSRSQLKRALAHLFSVAFVVTAGERNQARYRWAAQE